MMADRSCIYCICLIVNIILAGFDCYCGAGGVLISTIFFPKMHTISQQSKYRKLKMHSGGSDSTVYTTYTTDYPR